MYRLILGSLLPLVILAQDNPIPRTTSLTVQGFKVEINKCEKLSTKQITCYFTVTNSQADRILQLHARHAPSYFVDGGGMQVGAHQGRLGSSSHDWGGETDAVTDVPIKAQLDFGVGDPRATLIAKLSIVFDCKGVFRVEFRKIPLEGS